MKYNTAVLGVVLPHYSWAVTSSNEIIPPRFQEEYLYINTWSGNKTVYFW